MYTASMNECQKCSRGGAAEDILRQPPVPIFKANIKNTYYRGVGEWGFSRKDHSTLAMSTSPTKNLHSSLVYRNTASVLFLFHYEAGS